jgi:hypothetical protein
VKRAWIGIGLRLELRLGKRRVSTSPVERIAIEGSVGVQAEPLARTVVLSAS